MSYRITTDTELENQLKKLYKKDRTVYNYINKKIRQISANPSIGKPLRNILKGTRRIHIGSYVLIYEVDEQNKAIILLSFEHHDKAYKR
jgi:addiction module RelE/StbE family toxin